MRAPVQLHRSLAGCIKPLRDGAHVEALRIAEGQLPQGLWRWASTHSSLPLLLLQLLPHPEELFVLAGNKVNGCVLQQCSKDKKQAHRHPDVYGLHVGHLPIREKLSSEITKIT